MSALIAIVVFALSGAGLLVAGVYVLAGHGFAMVLGGLLLLGLAFLVRTGLTANG